MCSSWSRNNQLTPQILEVVLVQLACVNIVGVHVVVLSHVVDLEGLAIDDNNRGDSFASIQILGSQPDCFVQQLAVAHLPSPVLHGSRCPSFKFVTPDDCCAPMLRSWGDCKNGTYPMCGELCGYASGEFVAIRILSKKLVGAIQTM